MVTIITDSTADLSPSLVSKYHIKVIPLHVIHNNHTYQDGLDIDPHKLYELVDSTGELPKTSAPSPAEFHAVFDTVPEGIYIGISSRLSSSVQNATLVADSEMDHRIRVVDSLNLSTGIGLLVLHASDLADQGHSLEQIYQAVTALVPRVRSSYLIDTLEYAYLSGRCTALQNIVGSGLKIRPVIGVDQDGTLDVKRKFWGTRKKALQSLLADFQDHLPEIDLHRVFVTHTGCDQDAEYLVGELRKIADIADLQITIAGSVITSHCGPNTIGILYIVNS